jgi:hypothetical protein
MYVERQFEACSCNHCSSAVSITYNVSMSVALGIQHAMRAPNCHLWPFRLYNIILHYLINGTIFEKKVTEHKTCVLILSAILSETILILKINERDMI